MQGQKKNKTSSLDWSDEWFSESTDVAEGDPDADCRSLAVQSLVVLDKSLKKQLEEKESSWSETQKKKKKKQDQDCYELLNLSLPSSRIGMWQDGITAKRKKKKILHVANLQKVLF